MPSFASARSTTMIISAALAVVGLAGGASAAVEGAEVVKTPPLGRVASFSATSFAAPDDGWAVGSVGESLEGSGIDTLVEHWDGAAWEVAATSPVEHSDEALTDVVVFGSDGWAVGWQDRYGYNDDLPLLFRLSGSSWASVRPPSSAIPTAVGGSGPDDVWAVGSNVIEHFDGSAWASQRAPNARAVVLSVSAAAPDDAWMAGYVPVDEPGYDHTGHPYVAHWDGARWSRVRVPHPVTDARLASISAGSATDVWAVGSAAATARNPRSAFVLHFDGVRWQRVRTADEGGGNYGLTGVETLSATEAWAVGHRDGYTEEGYAVWRTLIQRWNGHRWRVVRSPNDDDHDSFLTSVTASGSAVWALGGNGAALAERVTR